MNATKENAIINMVPEVIDKITDFLGKNLTTRTKTRNNFTEF